MHGFALTALTNRPARFIISEQAKDKHVSRIDLSHEVKTKSCCGPPPKIARNRFEYLPYKDKIVMFLVRRFLMVQQKSGGLK